MHRFAGHGLPVALLLAAWSRNGADHQCSLELHEGSLGHRIRAVLTFRPFIVDRVRDCQTQRMCLLRKLLAACCSAAVYPSMTSLQGQLRPFTCVRPALTKRSTVLSPSVHLPKPVLHLNRCKLWSHASYGPLTCKFALLDQAWGTHVNAQVLLAKPALVSLKGTRSCPERITTVQELATNIFSTSIFPYSAFLYFLTKSKKTPPVALFGFYFLLFFVFATIPAGVIGKLVLPRLAAAASMQYVTQRIALQP